ncbi:MAG: hypothetical protein AAF694_12835 [Bacteroidota bacterium]
MKPIVLPEEKLDELANKVCARILDGHYFTNGVIRGEELKDFADHQQVNKFLLFQIYQTWNLQLSKLKHSYFDFSHPEVEQGLKSLRNLLSRHIQISEKDFQPLLKRAVYNNIKLLLNPEASFESFFFVDNDSISLETFSQYGPFFSDMDFIVNSILRYHQKHQLDAVEKGMFFLKMDKVIDLYNQKSNMPFEDYQKQTLNKLLKEDIDTILKEVEEAKQKTLPSPPNEDIVEEVETPEPVVENTTAPEIEETQVEPEVTKEEPNFFESVIADENSLHFDFSDDMDLSESLAVEEVPAIPSEPEPSPETIIPPVYEPKAIVEEPVLPPSSPVETPEPPVATPPPVEPVSPLETTPPVEPAYTAPVRNEEIQEPTQPSTVEEALSAFLNKDKPSKSVFDSLSEPAESTAKPETFAPPAFDSFTPPPAETSPNPPVFNQFLEESNGEYVSSTPATSNPTPTPDQPQTIAEKYHSQVSSEPVAAPSNGVGKEIKLSDIPIHRQYQYVQKVFEGNNVRFRIIVDKVNNSKNRDEVESIIDRFILSNSGLNKSDEVVQEFIKMLRSRH